jgi:hypothetical protein
VAGLTARHRHTAPAYSHSGLSAGVAKPPVLGYAAWWDATQIPGAVNGAAVPVWPDASTNGHDLAQPTGANQPTYQAAGVNGHPAVNFPNTAGQFMKTAANFTQAQPFTTVLVANNANAASTNYIWYDLLNNVNFLRGTAGGLPWHVYAGTHHDSALAPGTGLHFVAVGLSGAASYLRQDAAKDGPFNPGSFGWGGGIVNIGANDAGTGCWQGQMCEMLIYPSLLSDANLTALQGYTQTKWGTP